MPTPRCTTLRGVGATKLGIIGFAHQHRLHEGRLRSIREVMRGSLALSARTIESLVAPPALMSHPGHHFARAVSAAHASTADPPPPTRISSPTRRATRLFQARGAFEVDQRGLDRVGQRLDIVGNLRGGNKAEIN